MPYFIAGVTEIGEAGDKVDGSVTLVEGSNVTITRSGQSITIASSGGGGLTVGSTTIASGTSGRILFEDSSNVLQESSSLYWDNSDEFLGVGSTTVEAPITVSTIRTVDANSPGKSGVNTSDYKAINTITIVGPSVSFSSFFCNKTVVHGDGVTTASGFNGQVFFWDSSTCKNGIAAQTNIAYYYSLYVLPTMFADAASISVLRFRGVHASTNWSRTSTNTITATYWHGLYAAPNTSDSWVTITDGAAVWAEGSSRCVNWYGLYVADVTATTLTAAVRSRLKSGTGKWDLYLDGGADSFIAGNVRIGGVATVPTDELEVQGTMAFYGTTSGNVKIKAAAAAGTGITLTLPTSTPTANQILETTDTAGTLQWVNTPAGASPQTFTMNEGISAVGGNSTKTVVYGQTTAANEPPTMPKSGKIWGMSISLNTARTAGTCTAEFYVDGVVNGTNTVVIDATNTQHFYQAFGTPTTFTAGQRIGMGTTTSSFTPTGSDATLCLFITFD
jgi:hypothetical protein